MEHIFVIDDSVSVCLGIEQALAKHNLTVTSVRLGETARRALSRETPDLIICDVILPDVDGLDLCAELKDTPRTADIPIVVISGLVDDDLRQRARQIGCVDLLEKPFEEGALYHRVRELLASRKRDSSSAEPTLAKTASHTLTQANQDAIEQLLKPLWVVMSWRTTALITSDGHLLYSAGQALHQGWVVELAQLASATTRLAHHATQGPWKSLIVESEPGITLLSNLADQRVLAVVLEHSAGLGMVRWLTKRLLPKLEELVESYAPETM